MRTRILDALLPKTRQAVLAATLLHPKKSWYGAELARHLGLSRSTLQRELEALSQAGILTETTRGRHVYYQANRESPVFLDLQGLLRKTAGVTEVLRELLSPYEELISFAFVYGSIARGDELDTSDVDLLILGTLTLRDLSAALVEAEKQLLRPVHANVWETAEFESKLQAGDSFVESLLAEPKLFVLGNVHGLEAIAEREEGGRASSHKKRGGVSPRGSKKKPKRR